MKVCFKCNRGVPEELRGIHFTPYEQSMMSKLLERRVVSYNSFGETSRGGGSPKHIKVHVCRLKRVLRGSFFSIENVFEIGYRLIGPTHCPSSSQSICFSCGAGVPEEMLGLSLQPYQHYMLTELLEDEGKVVPYTRFKKTYRSNRNPKSVHLQVHICLIRDALNDLGSNYFVETVHRVGFKLIKEDFGRSSGVDYSMGLRL